MNAIYREIAKKRSSVLEIWRSNFWSELGMPYQSTVGSVNRFTESVAYLVNESANDIIAWLLRERADIPESLIDLCRLEAVQKTNPSQSLRFILGLKLAIRQALPETGKDACRGVEFNEVDRRIDDLVLFAFDWYVEFREKLYQIQIDEIQRSEGYMKNRCGGRRVELEVEAV